MVFGVTSPKIKTRRVIKPVAIPAPALPKNFVASTVAMEDAEIFTMLFPIKIALNSFPGASITFASTMARSSPSSTSARTRSLLTVVSAVSAEEKNADNANKITKTTNCMASLGPKINSLLCTIDVLIFV